jgi:hypothetical protein
MAKRMEQLKKIKMPAKPMAEQEADLDIDLELEDMPAGEAPEMTDDMPEEISESDDMMADLDDDMIIEEMLKRGLTLPAEDMEAEEEGEEDMDAEEIDLEDMV